MGTNLASPGPCHKDDTILALLRKPPPRRRDIDRRRMGAFDRLYPAALVLNVGSRSTDSADHHFADRPDERRRGIGRLLVKAAEQAARVAGCGGLKLLSAADEEALHDFCRATGFTSVGPRFMRPLRKRGSRSHDARAAPA